MLDTVLAPGDMTAVMEGTVPTLVELLSSDVNQVHM